MSADISNYLEKTVYVVAKTVNTKSADCASKLFSLIPSSYQVQRFEVHSALSDTFSTLSCTVLYFGRYSKLDESDHISQRWKRNWNIIKKNSTQNPDYYFFTKYLGKNAILYGRVQMHLKLKNFVAIRWHQSFTTPSRDRQRCVQVFCTARVTGFSRRRWNVLILC